MRFYGLLLIQGRAGQGQARLGDGRPRRDGDGRVADFGLPFLLGRISNASNT